MSVQEPQPDDPLREFVDLYLDEAIRQHNAHDHQTRLEVEAGDLYEYDPDLFEQWLEDPELVKFGPPTDTGLVQEIRHRCDGPVTVHLTDTGDYIRRQAVTSVTESDIGTYSAIQGQLSRVTKTKPRLKRAVYECARCGSKGITVSQSRTEVREPHECEACERQGPFNLQVDESEWVDQRKLKLEQPVSERTRAKGGSIPVYVEGPLCDMGGENGLADRSGEQITVFGTVNVDESELSGRNADPETDYWIDAEAFEFDTERADDVDVSAHREEFERYAEQDGVLDLVAGSLAPGLYAEEGDRLYAAKRAAALWLFNAPRLEGENATKRGDIHMALIGDPSTGKSTLMEYLHEVLPKSEFRSGTALSEVGLTAAAEQEEFAGSTEWVLNPGILPRANGGHALIDEIDAVVDSDTKAMHDALEGSQMLRVDKAGMKADLPTRTALMVGGNPKETRIQPNGPPLPQQVDIDAALYDRLDFVYILVDSVEEDRDERMASHIVDTWDGLSSDEDADEAEPDVPQDVLTAWIKDARERIQPELTDEAKQALVDYFLDVRQMNDSETIPATPRNLDAGVRAAIAHARMRLSDTVELQDAEVGISVAKRDVGNNWDPHTNEFDADRHRTTPKSDTKDLDTQIRDICEHGADLQEIKGQVEGPHDEAKIEHRVDKMRTNGRLFTPSTGIYEAT